MKEDERTKAGDLLATLPGRTISSTAETVSGATGYREIRVFLRTVQLGTLELTSHTHPVQLNV